MSKPKKISAKERLEVYENFFHRLHFLRYVAADHERVAKLLMISDGLIDAKATHGPKGPLDADTIQENMNNALEKMKVLP